jgi:hypothetical protein
MAGAVYPGGDDWSEGGSGDRSRAMKREGRLGLGIGLGLRRERTSSFLSGMAGC